MGGRRSGTIQSIVEKTGKETFMTLRGTVTHGGHEDAYDVQTVDGAYLSAMLEMYAGNEIIIAILGTEKR